MDFYEVLGVEKDSTSDDIKKAFRQKARKLHPDVNKDPNAEEQFKELGKAYETLMDDEKRQMYDRYGEEGLQNAGYNTNGPFDFGFGDINDIFSAFFGGGMGGFSGGGRQNPNSPQRGSDLRLDIEIEFMESMFGVEKEIKIDHLEPCETCNSTGLDKNATETVCPTCKGHGRVQQSTQTILGSFTSVGTCPSCNGTGKNPKAACKSCKGAGAVAKEKKIKIKIPQGVDNGSKIRLSNEGDAGKNGGRTGDLYIVLHVKESKEFLRDGVDIHSVLEISMPQAALGDEVEVNTIDGEVKIHVPSGVQNLEKLLIKGKGVPYLGDEHKRGNHYATVKVKTPKKLSSEEEKLYKQLLEIQSGSKKGGIMEKVKTALHK